MKKILAVVLSTVMALGLVGCGEKGGTSAGGDGKTLIGVAMPTQAAQRWNQDGDNIKKQLEEKGYQVELQYANDDVNTQVQQLENMITRGVEVLVIASIDGSALTDVLNKANEQDIKVIAYDRLIRESEHVSYYATFDNYKVGQMQGQYLVDELGLAEGKGPFNIELFAGSPDDNNAGFFFNGAMDALAPYFDSGMVNVPSGQTEFSQVTHQNWRSDLAQSRMDDIIAKNYSEGQSLDAVYSSADILTQGVIPALTSAGYNTSSKPYPIITGQDADSASVKAILSGQQSMTIFKDTRTLAEVTVGMVEAIINETEVEVNDTTTYDNGKIVVPSFLCSPVLVTIDNYEAELIDTGYYKAEDLQ